MNIMIKTLKCCASLETVPRGPRSPHKDPILFLFTNQAMLSSQQTNDLLTAHCYRVIDNMSADDLFSYAMQMMMQSFDQNPGQGDTDLELLIEDIRVTEGGSDEAFDYIVGCGIDKNEVAKTFNHYQIT